MRTANRIFKEKNNTKKRQITAYICTRSRICSNKNILHIHANRNGFAILISNFPCSYQRTACTYRTYEKTLQCLCAAYETYIRDFITKHPLPGARSNHRILAHASWHRVHANSNRIIKRTFDAPPPSHIKNPKHMIRVRKYLRRRLKLTNKKKISIWKISNKLGSWIYKLKAFFFTNFITIFIYLYLYIYTRINRKINENSLM